MMTTLSKPEGDKVPGHLRLRLILIALAITGGAFIVWFANQVAQVSPNAYAVWWTADLVIEHMETHAGAWPRNWEELRLTSEIADRGTTSTNHGNPWIAEFRPRASIEELQRRVEIVWQADPGQLVKSEFKPGEPPFQVIRLRNGKSHHYTGKEPNEMILDYLKWKQNEITGTADRSQPITP
ncbi:MAG: hypothetical protein KIT22_07970 [Verrucomicrobiae bacterium]|nr:hypothetical protein [Verrucomicrobiae bacterium]